MMIDNSYRYDCLPEFFGRSRFYFYRGGYTRRFQIRNQNSQSLVVRRLHSHSAMNFNISFLFFTRIFARSDIISLLEGIFISSKFSGWILSDLVEAAIKFWGWLLSPPEDSNSPRLAQLQLFFFDF